MTKTENTAISVSYKKKIIKMSYLFRRVECNFRTGVFWFESPTAIGLVCSLFDLLTSSRRTQILVLTSIRPSPHYLTFTFQEHVKLTMAEQLSTTTNCML